MDSFIDRTAVHAVAGDGGKGCASVLREKFRPLGGPDGGNGGRGGSIILVVDPSVTSLLEFHRHPHLMARPGGPGRGGNQHGQNGGDRRLHVPDGTVVVDGTGNVVADLVGAGTEHILARGGRGGLGNAALASKRRKAPGFALLGEEGERAEAHLELRTVADAALVGFPSAGKSSLIAAMSAARPKIADYPFTTLTPHLGVVEGSRGTFAVADVPGLVPGASQGKGLGLGFLRHIERCSVIVHVLDCATLEPDRDPLTDLDVIEQELADYGGLQDKPRMVVLHKIDVPEARELAEFVQPELLERGWDAHLVSAVSHDGLRQFRYALGDVVARERVVISAASHGPRIVIRPEPVDGPGFSVRRSDDGFHVRGALPDRWVTQTDFGNDEAVSYLAEKLARLGVEDELTVQGARPGATVIIGAGDDPVVFEWEPAMAAAERPTGPRGTDARLEGR